MLLPNPSIIMSINCLCKREVQEMKKKKLKFKHLNKKCYIFPLHVIEQ